MATFVGSVIGFIDVPGHEKFIHNMLAGATGKRGFAEVEPGFDPVLGRLRARRWSAVGSNQIVSRANRTSKRSISSSSGASR